MLFEGVTCDSMESAGAHYFTERNGMERNKLVHYFTERNGTDRNVI